MKKLKKLNKILGILLLCVLGCFAASSCGDKEDSDKIVITYWHANGAELTKVLETIKAEFEAKYEGKYEVQLTSQGDYDALREQITSAISGGIAPTAAQTYPDHISLYLQGNALVALDEYINNSDPEIGLSKEEQAQFIEGFWKEGTIYDKAGTRYGMPFNKSTELMYYNKDIFTKYSWDVPQTWDQVIDIAEKWKDTPEYAAAVAEYNQNGSKQVYALGYDSEANLFITFVQQYGAVYTSFDANGRGIYNAFGDVTEDVNKAKNAMNWYLDNFNKGNIATSSAFGTDYCSDAFKNGQCIMTIGSSAGATYNDGSASSKTKFTTAVAPVPQKDLDHGQVIQQGTNVSLFKCKDKEEELGGWLWLKFLTSYESALTWALNTSYFPIRYDVLNSQEYQDHILGKITADDGSVMYRQSLAAQAKQVGLSQQNWFYTNVAFPGSAKARTNAETIVQQILYGSGVTVDRAFTDALNAIKND